MILTVFIPSCGRRGDPVPIEPRIEKPSEQKAAEKTEPVQPDVLQENRKTSEMPEAPTGLVGVYTESDVVLTWGEHKGEDVRYRVYRSEGNDYVLAGETVTPAFTDSAVQPDKKYHYRVTAVGINEGPPSKEIIIITEIH